METTAPTSSRIPSERQETRACPFHFLLVRSLQLFVAAFLFGLLATLLPPTLKPFFQKEAMTPSSIGGQNTPFLSDCAAA